MNVKTQRRKAQESDSHHDVQQRFRLRLGLCIRSLAFINYSGILAERPHCSRSDICWENMQCSVLDVHLMISPCVFFFHKWAKVKITCSWYYVYHNCIYLNTHSVVKEQVQEWHIPAWCIETISITKQSNLFSELTAMWNSHVVADGWGQGKPGNWRRKKHAYIIIGNVWGSGCQLGDP